MQITPEQQRVAEGILSAQLPGARLIGEPVSGSKADRVWVSQQYINSTHSMGLIFRPDGSVEPTVRLPLSRASKARERMRR